MACSEKLLGSADRFGLLSTCPLHSAQGELILQGTNGLYRMRQQPCHQSFGPSGTHSAEFKFSPSDAWFHPRARAVRIMSTRRPASSAAALAFFDADKPTCWHSEQAAGHRQEDLRDRVPDCTEGASSRASAE